MNLTDSFLGFTDGKNPLQKAKIETVLEKVYRYDGVIMSRKNFVFDRLLKGYVPDCREDVIRYGVRSGEPLEPKTEYRLAGNDDYSYQICKTEYDFANYLLEKGLASEQAAEAFISAENDRLLSDRHSREAEEQQKREAKDQEQKDAKEFENWLALQAASYEDQQKIQLQRDIFLNLAGSYYPKAVELLVLIDNIDMPRCKNALKGRLRYSNNASKKTFECVTGIKLPKTDMDTIIFLAKITAADYKGIKPFKPRKEAGPVQQDVFHIYDNRSSQFIAVSGEPFTKYGLEMFIIKKEKQYRISEARSGALLVTGATKQAAIDELKNIVDRVTIEGIKAKSAEFIAKYGLSPRYQNAA